MGVSALKPAESVDLAPLLGKPASSSNKLGSFASTETGTLEFSEKGHPTQIVKPLEVKVPAELRRFMETPIFVKFTPEYAYKTFALSFPTLPPQDTSLFKEVQQVREEQLSLAKKILSASDQTKVVFFIRRDEETAFIMRDLRSFFEPSKMRFANRVSFIDEGRYDRWAQDWGETTGGKNAQFFMSWSTQKHFYDSQAPWVVPQSFEIPKFLNVRVHTLPAVLQGGNMTKATVKGKNLVVIGEGIVEQTQTQYQERYSYPISPDEIKQLLKKAFKADDVLVLKSKTDSMFHIDQALFFPGDGVAVVAQLPEHERSTKEAEVLEGYCKQLSELGFDIVRIPTSLEHIRAYKAYANSMTIQDKEKTTIIMSSFAYPKGSRVELVGKLEDEIQKILKSKNMEVTFIPNHTYSRTGNLHCMVGVLE